MRDPVGNELQLSLSSGIIDDFFNSLSRLSGGFLGVLNEDIANFRMKLFESVLSVTLSALPWITKPTPGLCLSNPSGLQDHPLRFAVQEVFLWWTSSVWPAHFPGLPPLLPCPLPLGTGSEVAQSRGKYATKDGQSSSLLGLWSFTGRLVMAVADSRPWRDNTLVTCPFLSFSN